MPANVTPDYERAEAAFRQASTDDEKLAALEEMLRMIPKHKGTEKMQADIKRRISQLRKAGGKKAAQKKIDPFYVPKSGAGQVVLLGPPNVGKSMLVAATTNAHVKVTDYPYATALPVPGMWQYEDVQIELVDTPPITPDHVPGNLMSTVRQTDIVAAVVDLATDPLGQIGSVLEILTSRDLALTTTPRNELDPKDTGRLCGLIVCTRLDLSSPEDAEAFRELYAGDLEVFPVSAVTGEGLDALQQRLWQLLAVTRAYTKKPGGPADHDNPFTLSVGSTVEDLARSIHRELPEKMKYARIWGAGRFDGQQVHKTEQLIDKDIVEIHE
ncbi:MAG: GTPase [Planctomycetota bacterium]|jgi:ribosome-interacting GTPase 1